MANTYALELSPEELTRLIIISTDKERRLILSKLSDEQKRKFALELPEMVGKLIISRFKAN